MLQQTQVQRVMEHLPRWLKRFPNVGKLASASKRDVLLAWSGMGYNRRALNLHAAAKRIADEYAGIVPDSIEALKSLPGIGAYSAAAVACFAYNKRVPMLEVNIRRVLSRVSEKLQFEPDMLPEKTLEKLAEVYLPARAYYNWNQALMDLGATICTATRPQCTLCPLEAHCESSGSLLATARVTSGTVKEVPRRIFRGKIIEFLRNSVGTHEQSFGEIGRHLKQGFSQESHTWLIDILDSLEQDSMITIHKGRRRIQIREFEGEYYKLRIRLTE
jgi:A/G-specific adenine glycosylase